MIRKNHYLCCGKPLLLFKMHESLYKKHSPLISILMPVYNASPYLVECINSIREQLYTNWELIAVDDFSTDDSLNILEMFAKKDFRITVHNNTEKGIIPALKLAEPLSKGAFISRMDADDIMPIDKLQLFINAFALDESIDLVTGKVKYISSGKELMDGYKRYANWLNSLIDRQDFILDKYKECVIASPNWLIKRSSLEKIGGVCSDKYPEDYDFVMRVLHKQLRITGVDSVTHIWRDHPGRTSRNSDTYSDNRFIELKCHYFKKIDFKPSLPPVLWGAGKKAKKIAKELNYLDVEFYWICNNKKKAGHKVYGQMIYYFEDFLFTSGQHIIIATTLDRKTLFTYCKRKQLNPLPFC